jgi:7-cyano-7-deazaguanine reductase
MTPEIPLGRATTYPEQYSPELLYAIARTGSRAALGIGDELPFHGSDIWNAWELTWLNPEGLPRVATAEISVPAQSPNIIESKSLKLYLGSFAMTEFESDTDVTAAITKDLSACVRAEVDLSLRAPSISDDAAIAQLAGDCIDSMAVSCDTYEVDPELLRADDGEVGSEDLHSHLLRSLCPVTDQPDMGSVMISYKGPRIDREGLLRYVISYRQHKDFHESCVERMFIDILERCAPERLTVYARYQRRGGIDINPFRSDFEQIPANTRLWRQ